MIWFITIFDKNRKQAEKLKSRKIKGWRMTMKVVMKVMVKAVMKVWWKCDEGGGEGSDEGEMKKILSCLRGFASWQTDGRTNRRTLVIVESLSRLKIKRKRELTSYNSWYARFQLRFPCNSCMTLIHWWHPVKWLISSSSPKIMSPSWNNSGSKIFRRATKPRLGWKTIQNYAMLVITGLRLVKGRVLLRNLVKKEEWIH